MAEETAPVAPRHRFAPAWAFAVAGACLALLFVDLTRPRTALLEWSLLLAVVALPGWLATGLYLVNRESGAVVPTRRAHALLILFSVGLALVTTLALALLLFSAWRAAGIAFLVAWAVSVILLDRGLSGGARR
jgi:hypothetical protein